MAAPTPAAIVYGPGRPAAAVRAIGELAAARAALSGWADTPAMVRRYRDALEVRNAYGEYGDSFRGH